MSAKKSRFDGLDVAAMTAHLRRTMLGFKVANVYDGSALGIGSATGGGGDGPSSGSKGVYVFKLADPSGGIAPTNSTTANNHVPDGKKSTSGEDAPKIDGMTSETQLREVVTPPENSKRAMLLLESGVRFHPTNHHSASTSSTGGGAGMPSNFAMKLRKHLRNLRLENVTQLGNLDRVVDFKFGSGSYAHHLILELYAQGNLILTDGEYRILGLLRVHEYEVVKGDADDDANGDETRDKKKKEEVKVRVGNIYPVTFATTLSAGSNSGNQSREESEENNSSCQGLLDMSGTEAYEWAKSELLSLKNRMNELNDNNDNESETKNGKGGGEKGGKKIKKGGMANAGGKKKKAMDDSLVLKALLLKPSSGVYHYGPSLIEHCIHVAGLDPVSKLSHNNIDYTIPETSWNDLTDALRTEGKRVIENFNSGVNGGYILYKDKTPLGNGDNQISKENNDSLLSTPLPNQNQHSDKILLEFQPHLLRQHQHQKSLSYATFAVAVDEFFSHLSSQKIAQRADAAEAAAREKLSKIQLDQQRRVEALVMEQERWKDNARLVEMHAEDVDRALGVINSALATGMDWEALDQLVSVEQQNENPIALLIHKLDLENEIVVLSLPDIDDWDESDPDRPPKLYNVSVSIKESAHGNARNMFSHYRALKEKEEKTIEASTMALKAAEAKAQQQLAEAQKKKQRINVLPPRKVYWFEKFAWFITSDNYLVVAGKDAQQNEQLVKRYLRPGDAYLHAEVHGAATCILRAKRRRRKDGKTQVVPLSDQALREAGNFTICRSSAWSSKMVTSAYWVESHQVSKTAPTGEYLTVGSFMIRGRKNFLPASSLEMGLGVLFRLGDDASIARHTNERRDFALMEQEELFAKQDELILNKMDTPKNEDNDAPDSSNSEEADKECTSGQLNGDEHLDPDNGAEELDTPEEEGNLDLKCTDDEESPENEPLEDVGSNEENESYELQSNDKSVSLKNEGRPKQNANSSKKKTRELTRGKRSKNRRAMKKYSEQDDEDRALAMMALQGGESFKKGKKRGGSRIAAKQSETQQKAAAETMALLVRDSKEVAETLDKSVHDVLAKCVTLKVTKSSEGVRWSKFDAEVLEQLREMDSLEEQLAVANRLLDLSKNTRIDNYSASLAGIIRTIKKHGIDRLSAVTKIDGKQRKTRAEKDAENEEWQKILAEDGIIEGGDEEDGDVVDDTGELSQLTGKPTPQDVILCAVPVCAPYSVLSQYKYRVKLTPGAVKRGKASKQCVEMFLHSDNDKKKSDDVGTKRDKDLIKLVNENEWVQAIIGDVRITSAGASKVAKKQKGNKGKSK